MGRFKYWLGRSSRSDAPGFVGWEFQFPFADDDPRGKTIHADAVEVATAETDVCRGMGYLVIGTLSSVVDDSVQFYWDFVSEGTAAEGAILHFRRIPAELACQACGQTYSPDENLTCPVCESSNIQIISGQEFFLEAIEIAEDTTGKPAIITGEATS